MSVALALRTARPIALAALAVPAAVRTDMPGPALGAMACVAALLVWFDVRLLDDAAPRLRLDVAATRERLREVFGLGPVGLVVVPLFTTLTCVICVYAALTMVTDGLPGLALALSVGAGIVARALLGAAAMMLCSARARAAVRAAFT